MDEYDQGFVAPGHPDLPAGRAGRPPYPLTGAFDSVCDEAVRRGKRLMIRYRDAVGNQTVRTISPAAVSEGLVFAFCHLRNDGRCFALARILMAEVIDSPADERGLRIALKHKALKVRPPRRRRHGADEAFVWLVLIAAAIGAIRWLFF